MTDSTVSWEVYFMLNIIIPGMQFKTAEIESFLLKIQKNTRGNL